MAFTLERNLKQQLPFAALNWPLEAPISLFPFQSSSINKLSVGFAVFFTNLWPTRTRNPAPKDILFYSFVTKVESFYQLLAIKIIFVSPLPQTLLSLFESCLFVNANLFSIIIPGLCPHSNDHPILLSVVSLLERVSSCTQLT